MATSWQFDYKLFYSTKYGRQYGAVNNFKEDEAKGERDEDFDVVSFLI